MLNIKLIHLSVIALLFFSTSMLHAEVIEVVTMKLKDGVSYQEFAKADKAVEAEHVAKQPGFISRESAAGTDGEWLVLVRWETVEAAEASMNSFMEAEAAQPFMEHIMPSSIVMKRYSTEEKKLMVPSAKERAKALLESIETGDQTPVSYINPDKYIQHNLAVADGLAGFGEVLKVLDGKGKANVIRVFQDGNFVFTHTKYDFFGPKVGFDIFRFEDGKIVEHWDNLQELVTKTASGRTQLDGPTEATDLNKTQENKALIKDFVNDVLMGKNPGKITDYISTEKYYQHNPAVADGLEALGGAIKAMADAGTPMAYTANHAILGEGNFVLTVSEGQFLGKHSSFYDLFRIEDGKIVEHWDTIETIPPKSEWKNDNGKFGDNLPK